MQPVRNRVSHNSALVADFGSFQETGVKRGLTYSGRASAGKNLLLVLMRRSREVKGGRSGVRTNTPAVLANTRIHTEDPRYSLSLRTHLNLRRQEKENPNPPAAPGGPGAHQRHAKRRRTHAIKQEIYIPGLCLCSSIGMGRERDFRMFISSHAQFTWPAAVGRVSASLLTRPSFFVLSWKLIIQILPILEIQTNPDSLLFFIFFCENLE